MQKNTKKALLNSLSLVFLLITCLTVGLLYYNDRYLLDQESVSFNSASGIKLKGFYYPGTINAGVMLLEGFGADQLMLKGFVMEFAKLGFHVFSFDFSGHGLSYGSIGFDNAATDVLAYQVLTAENIFKEKSGLLDSQILYMGHSMGSRVGLQAATIDNTIAGLILVGTSINLDVNLQSNFFTGVRDTDLQWIQNLNGSNPATDVLLMSGGWDDILTPTAANLLFEKLGGNSSPYNRELMIFDHMIHNYEIYSPRIITYALNWAINKFSLGFGVVSASTMLNRKILWSTGIVSLFSTLILFNFSLNLKKKEAEIDTLPSITITDTSKFLWGKILLWLFSLPLCVILAAVLSFIPIGVPVFNIIYVGFIAGYGMFMLILYRFRKKKLIPGVQGIFKLNPNTTIPISNMFKGLGLSFGVIGMSILFARSGIYGVFPMNFRLIWLALFTIVTIPAFYITQLEHEWIARTCRVQLTSFLHILIGYIPFILMTILFLTLGSISGMIGSIHGLIIIALVIILGNLLRTIVKNNLFISIIQAFLLYLLVLPQNALFAFF